MELTYSRDIDFGLSTSSDYGKEQDDSSIHSLESEILCYIDRTPAINLTESPKNRKKYPNLNFQVDWFSTYTTQILWDITFWNHKPLF